MNSNKSKNISIRCYEELNDFLPLALRKVQFHQRVTQHASIKDILESLGIPHPEIDLILVNGQSVNFQYIPKEGDQISVYPVFEKLDISEVTHLRAKTLRQTKFILDVHLGKLTRLLRMLGFDCNYRNDFTDIEIIDLAKQQKRIILTRDVDLLKNKKVSHGYWIRNTNPQKQLLEVIRVFQLESQISAFKRCMDCNGIIAKVAKEIIQNQLPPKTKQYYQAFYQCQNCKKIYWEGSHYDKMLKLIKSLRD